MFCTACAAQTPPTLPRCAVCGTPLPRATSPVTGTLARRHAERRSPRRHLRRMLSTVPLVLILVTVSLGVNQYRVEQAALAAAYADAEQALAAGDFAAAIDRFADAGSYRDADSRRAAVIAEITPYRAAYLTGVDALNAGDYDAAIAALVTVVRDLPTFENAAELLTQARSQRTQALLAQVEQAELRRDWLLAERLLGQLVAENPGDPALSERFSRLAQTHGQIVFSRDGGLYTIGPDSLDERLVTDELQAIWPVWSPTRTQIAFYASIDDRVANYALFVVDPDGSNLRQLAGNVEVRGWPNWSPDGTRIAFTSLEDFELDKNEGVSAIRVVEVATGNVTDYTSAAFHAVVWPTWSPDGTRLAFISKKIYHRGAAVGQRVQGALHTVDVRTGAIVDVVKGRLPFAAYLAWSPVDDLILVYSREFVTGGYETTIRTIALVDLRRDTVEQMTDRSQRVGIPIWSPDGARFAYTQTHNGKDTNVTIRSLAGDTAWIALPREVSPCLTWSPDGKLLLAPTYDSSQASFIIDPDNGAAMTDFLLNFDFGGQLYGPPQWAPASTLAYPTHPTVGGTALDRS